MPSRTNRVARVKRESERPPLGVLRDRLARFCLDDLRKYFGADLKDVQRRSSNVIVDESHVILTDNELVVNFPNDKVLHRGQWEMVTVTTRLLPRMPERLLWDCNHHAQRDLFILATMQFLLENKLTLRLAREPQLSPLPEMQTEAELMAFALAERQKRADEEPFQVESSNTKTPWTDYLITNGASGKTYRVALRGMAAGESFCNCPDFRTNTLGTCKHVLHAQGVARKSFKPAQLAKPFEPQSLAIHVRYGEELELALLAPRDLPDEVAKIVKPLQKGAIADVGDLMKRLSRLEKIETPVLIYPDAEMLIQQRLYEQRIADRVAEIRQNPAEHALRSTLLKTELLPYQLDGIAFAVGAGRAILADEMGLGKTIQGVGVAELFAREVGIERVLVVCPTSLKSQWRTEIVRFSDRDCQLIAGPVEMRHSQYAHGAFFTICNYEQVLRDVEAIESVMWDLIILDEGQRIKNWEAKTTRVVKGLRSRFALVLSGTPLENRLEELFSVVQFIDDRRLAPAFRFFHRHRIVDEHGKVKGYKKLDDLRERLQPVLLRRTRASVKQQLPGRTDTVIRVTPYQEQLDIESSQRRIVAEIVSKKFITEMDLLRMQKALLLARMACDSTYLVTKEAPGFSSKLEALDELLEQLLDEEDRKIILFSEWTTMLTLVEPLLTKRRASFVRLEGSVPQKKRAAIVHRFQHDADCRALLMSNAGATGLNLQAANTVINLDLPWNPAVLEQRIARAYRMGQSRPVQVYNLISDGTIEAGIFETLQAKQDLANAALDFDSDISELKFESSLEALRRRMEVVLAVAPAAPVDASQRVANREELEELSHRERISAAGGQLLSSALGFLGELVPNAQPDPGVVGSLKETLSECVTQDERGQSQLTLTLPGGEALEQLATALAKLLSIRADGPR